LTDDEVPSGPTGVWLEYEDGQRYEDLPTIYVGRDDNGCACFRVLTPRDEPPVAAGMATLPGMTSIEIPGLRPPHPAE
jgi:hypothetical protein